MVVEGVARVSGCQLVEQLGAALRREAGAHADVVQPTLVVVQAEQQRADALAVLVDAVAGDDAVGGALVLHLHQRALVGRVRIGEPLGDHAVEPGALELDEPPLRRRGVGGARAQVDRRLRASASIRSQLGRGVRDSGSSISDASPSASRSKATNDAGVSAASRLHPRLGRMDALQQRVEVEPAIVGGGDDDLAVDDAPLGQAARAAARSARGSSG